MFERFTDRAREVLVLAQGESRSLGHGRLLTAHLLLGVLALQERAAKSGSTVVETTGAVIDVDASAIRSGIDERPAVDPDGHLPFSAASKKALELALRETLQRGHADIEVRHVQLALLRDDTGGDLPRLLVRLGADVAALRRRTEDSLRSAPPRPGPTTTLQGGAGVRPVGPDPVAAQDGEYVTGIGAALTLDRAGRRERAVEAFASMWARLGPRGDPYQRCVVAYFAADVHDDVHDKLIWHQRALDAADAVGDDSYRADDPAAPVTGFYPGLHLRLAEVHIATGDRARARAHLDAARTCAHVLDDDEHGRGVRRSIEDLTATLADSADDPPAG